MNKFFLFLLLFVASLTTMQAQITGPAKVEATDEYEYAKYLEPLPMEDGHVVIARTITLPDNVNADETFAKMNEWVERCMKDDRILQEAPVEAEEPYTIRRMVRQDLIFSKALLAIDKAELSFCLEVKLEGNKMTFSMKRMSYRYNGDNPERKMLRLAAEDYISDKVAISKKNKLVFGYRKFRVKTIDLADEYTESLKTFFRI